MSSRSTWGILNMVTGQTTGYYGSRRQARRGVNQCNASADKRIYFVTRMGPLPDYQRYSWPMRRLMVSAGEHDSMYGPMVSWLKIAKPPIIDSPAYRAINDW